MRKQENWQQQKKTIWKYIYNNDHNKVLDFVLLDSYKTISQSVRLQWSLDHYKTARLQWSWKLCEFVL